MDAQLREASTPAIPGNSKAQWLLAQIIPFLRDRNAQVRQLALENLLPQTVKGAPHRSIFFSDLQSGGLQKPKENDIIRDLKILCRDQIVRIYPLNRYSPLIRFTERIP